MSSKDKSLKSNKVILWAGLLAVLICVFGYFIYESTSGNSKTNHLFNTYKANGIIEFNSLRFVSAIEQFSKALSLKPNDKGSLMHIVWSYKRAKRYDEMREYILKALQTYKGDADLMRELGYAYLESGNYDQAEKQFKQLIETEIDELGGFNGLAMVQKKKGNFSKALYLFNRGTPYIDELTKRKEHKDRIARHAIEYGLFLKEMGHPREAAAVFTQAAGLDDIAIEIYYYLAQIAEYLQERDRAILLYGEFVKITGGRLFENEIKIAKERIEILKASGDFLSSPESVYLEYDTEAMKEQLGY